MSKRTVVQYLALLIILFASGGAVGCAQRSFDESVITAGDKDPLWRTFAVREQAFENCAKAAATKAAAPAAKSKPAKKRPATAKATPKPVEKPAAPGAPGVAALLPQDSECPPGCVPAPRVNPAVVVPLSQVAPTAAPAPQPVPAATPPVVPPAAQVAPAVSGAAPTAEALAAPAPVPTPVAAGSLGIPVPVPAAVAP